MLQCDSQAQSSSSLKKVLDDQNINGISCQQQIQCNAKTFRAFSIGSLLRLSEFCLWKGVSELGPKPDSYLINPF